VKELLDFFVEGKHTLTVSVSYVEYTPWNRQTDGQTNFICRFPQWTRLA